MSRAIASALALLFVLAAAMPVAAADEVAADDAALAGAIVPGEVVVGWRNPDRGTRVARARGLSLVADLGPDATGGAPATVLSTEGRSVKTVIAELAADPAVAYAEPNYLFSLPDFEFEGGITAVAPASQGEITGVPVSDPQTAGQYSLNRMRVRDAWRRSTGGSNLIAVLDTGVQSAHPDLDGRVAKGYDFVNNDTSAADDNGHGTWVAGIIAANANDGYGIAGISWTDRILPVKIMNASGTGSTADLAAGIIWAADKGADVINMSVGGFPYSQAIQDAVNHAWSKGAVLIGAAGNNGRYENFYPASYEHVVSVSATQPEDEFSRWSSYGPKVDVSAPGSSVLTTNCTAGACPQPGLGRTHVHQRHELRDAERLGGRRAHPRAIPQLHAGAGRQPPAGHGRRPRVRGPRRSLRARARQRLPGVGRLGVAAGARVGRRARGEQLARQRQDDQARPDHRGLDLSGRRPGLVQGPGAERRPPRRPGDRRRRHASLSVEQERDPRRPDRRAVRQVREPDHPGRP